MDKRLTVYKPEYNDLWFRKKMLEDERTMSFNHTWGGTIAFPEEDWQSWYDHWISEDEGKRYYRYLKGIPKYFCGVADPVNVLCCAKALNILWSFHKHSCGL